MRGVLDGTGHGVEHFDFQADALLVVAVLRPIPDLRPLAGMPEVREGDRLGELICGAAAPADGEVVVVAQKIVSKSEGRLRRLADVEPGERARELAQRTGKDPAMVELALAESREASVAHPASRSAVLMPVSRATVAGSYRRFQ